MSLGDIIARLAVSLTLETAAFEQGATAAEKRLNQSAKRFDAMGQRLAGFGKSMSLAVTAPLLAFGVASVKAAAESEQALGQVNAALKSMGDGAGRTSEQLQGLATGIMRQSLYDDDEVLRKVTANLLTFGNVAGDNFDRAQKAAVDLAARMGTDLQGATLMVGKALNDPAKGLAALRRVGIQFTEQQQDQIKSMAAAGDAAGAQAIMLGELERQFGGSAKAMRDANPGAALKNSFDDLTESVGAKLLPILPRITAAITGVLDVFGKLSPGMQTAVIVAAGLAAALGPVLISVGALVSAFAPLIAAVATVGGAGGVLAGLKAALVGLAAGFGPILIPIAAFAAAGYLIYQNWDKIAPALEEFWQLVQTTLGPPLRELVDAVTEVFTALWDGPLGAMLKAAGAALINFQLTYAKVFGPILIGALKIVIETVTNVFRTIGDGIRLVSALFNGDWQGAFNAASSIVNRVFGGMPARVGAWMAEMVGTIRNWVVDKLNAVWTSVTDKIETVKKAFYSLADYLVFNSVIPDMVTAIGQHMARLDALMVEPAKKAAKGVTEAMRKAAEETRGLLDKLFPEVRARLDFQNERAAIERQKWSPAEMEEARFRSNRQFAGSSGDAYVSVLDTPALDVTKGLDAVLASLDKFGKQAGATTVQVAKSFKDMADATVQSLSNLANSIKGGGFLDILGAVIGLGMQLGSIGVFGKTIAGRINAPKVGQNANGTRDWRGGLSWIGERGPELVDLPRGSRVWPNGQGPSMGRGGNTYHFSGNLMTPEFWGIIQQGDMAAAQAGARGAQSRIAYEHSRRVE